jgi:hypothetical protein
MPRACTACKNIFALAEETPTSISTRQVQDIVLTLVCLLDLTRLGRLMERALGQTVN